VWFEGVLSEGTSLQEQTLIAPVRSGSACLNSFEPTLFAGFLDGGADAVNLEWTEGILKGLKHH